MSLEEERIGLEQRDWNSIETCVWGVNPLAPYHLGYDRFISAIDFLEEKGVETTIIFPKLHLQGIENIADRIDYYTTIFTECAPISPSVENGDFQLDREYCERLMELAGRATSKSVEKALPGKKNKEGVFEYLLPLSQILDPLYLDADIVLAGIPQRRVYMLGRDILNEDEKLPLYFIQLSKDIEENRLQKSTIETRINLHDSLETIENKLDRIEGTQEIHRYSVEPFLDEEDRTGQTSIDLKNRFRQTEKRLEEKGLMEWLDLEKIR